MLKTAGSKVWNYSAQPRWFRWCVPLLLIATIAAMVSPIMQGDTLDKADTQAIMKANFLFHFAASNEWPSETKSGPFRIAVVGNARLFQELIDKYALKSIGAQSLSAKGNSIAYLTIKYWYTEALKVDKTQYVKINDDLWNYFMRESNGSLFLKYELDYFNYKVIYTAKEIKPNRYENYKEKVSTDSPRVSK